LAGPSANTGSSSCIIGRPSLICVCWGLFGAWLLGRSNYDCIWLAKYPPLLCIEIEGHIMPCCTISLVAAAGLGMLLLKLYCSAYLVFMSADACLMECSLSEGRMADNPPAY
jgi:hypothetical protein